MKNFELTNETIVNDFGVTLHRIIAVKDIVTSHFTVKAGEFGGFVEKVDNLAGDAWVFRTNHYSVIGPIGSRGDYTTFFRSKEGTIKVKCGCFRGTTDEFLDKVEKTHGDSKYAKVYRIATEMALAQIDMN